MARTVIRSIIEGGRFNNVSEVVRAGLRRLEEDEDRLAAVRAALIEGENSGVVEGFDPEVFIKKLNDDYETELQTL